MVCPFLPCGEMFAARCLAWIGTGTVLTDGVAGNCAGDGAALSGVGVVLTCVDTVLIGVARYGAGWSFRGCHCSDDAVVVVVGVVLVSVVCDCGGF